MTVLNGKLIQALRDAEGIKQKELAQRAQISLRSLQKAEAGMSVGADTHNAIATALRVRSASALADPKLTINNLRRLRNGGYVMADDAGTISLKAIPPMPAAGPALFAQLLADDEDLGPQYATFHTQAYRQYRVFQRGSSGPQDLLELLNRAGMPLNVAQGTVELIDWPTEHVSQLTAPQKTLWKFVTGIYPARKPYLDGQVWDYSSIKPAKDAEAFHWARRKIAKHWDKWFPIVGWSVIGERFMTHRDEVLLITWLELALVQWTREPGMHKQGLFTLAQAYADTLSPVRKKKK
ncbi:helix-turn-helix domain-containing protein [Anatilimnocola floriformis]|uniref:helix-turn-helix domain-containing protein n=1 Tax=Anatilimnocola floriformis TaxID=2948575 RepID=UPI0020C3B4AF|nr:helix-turn-helix transcriptional regulator [Anatilimnocola floriformis]